MSSSDLHHNHQVTGAFVLGQAGFLLLLIVCIILLPDGLLANRGFSYFGDFARTRIPYTVALLIYGASLLPAVIYLPKGRPFLLIKAAFLVMIPLILGVIISTYSLAQEVITIHIRLGETLFVVELLLAGWLALFISKDRLNAMLFIIQMAAGLVSLLAVQNVLHWLIEGQIVYQLTFAGLIIHSLLRLQRVSALS